MATLSEQIRDLVYDVDRAYYNLPRQFLDYLITLSPQLYALLNGNIESGDGEFTAYQDTWTYSPVAGTALEVIADGDGDVTKSFASLYNISLTISGTSHAGLLQLSPGQSRDIYNDNDTNVLTVTCNANGSVFIQATAGTETYSVMLASMNWF